MSPQCVLDSSVALAWHFEDETDEYAERVLSSLNTGSCIAPSLWPLEIANILAVSERRGRISAKEVDEGARFLGDLPILIDPETSRRALWETLRIARGKKITVYDAAYLELALRENLPLVSLDEAMKRAAANLGIDLFDC